LIIFLPCPRQLYLHYTQFSKNKENSDAGERRFYADWGQGKSKKKKSDLMGVKTGRGIRRRLTQINADLRGFTRIMSMGRSGKSELISVKTGRGFGRRFTQRNADLNCG
jgi:hypothetical protein